MCLICAESAAAGVVIIYTGWRSYTHRVLDIARKVLIYLNFIGPENNA